MIHELVILRKICRQSLSLERTINNIHLTGKCHLLVYYRAWLQYYGLFFKRKERSIKAVWSESLMQNRESLCETLQCFLDLF